MLLLSLLLLLSFLFLSPLLVLVVVETVLLVFELICILGISDKTELLADKLVCADSFASECLSARLISFLHSIIRLKLKK